MASKKFFVHIDLQTNEIQNVVIQNLDTLGAPTGVKGQIYYNTDDDVLKYFDGSNWNDIGSGGAGSSAFNDITTGTNTSATMTVGTGGSLTYSGSGTVNANRFKGNTTIALTDGGTNASLTANNGGILYSTSSALAILSNPGASYRVLMSGNSSAPSWSTASYPSGAASPSGSLIIANGTNWTTSSVTYPGISTLGSQLGGLLYVSSSTAIGAMNTGTSGYILQSNGSSAPTFVDPATALSTTLSGYVTKTPNSLTRNDIQSSGDYVSLRLNLGASQSSANMFEIRDNSSNNMVYIGRTGGAVFNEQGNAADFRIESDSLDHAFYINGTNNKVAIGSVVSYAYSPICNVDQSSYNVPALGLTFSSLNSAHPFIIYDTNNGRGIFAISNNGTVYLPSTGAGDGGIIQMSGTDSNGGIILMNASADNNAGSIDLSSYGYYPGGSISLKSGSGGPPFGSGNDLSGGYIAMNSGSSLNATYGGGVAGYISMNGTDATSVADGGNAGGINLDGGISGASGGLSGSPQIGGNGGYWYGFGGASYFNAKGGNAGYIITAGGNAYNSSSSNFDGGAGGFIDTHGYAGSVSASGGYGGNIKTYAYSNYPGGHIYSNANVGGAGGNINTSAGSAAAGGSINLSGGTSAGGSLTMNNGGGSIVTNGATGSIQLGVSATRTTIQGSGSTVTYILPTNGTNGQYLQLSNNSTGQLTWANNTTTATFDSIGTGTNTSATMEVGSGASLTYSGGSGTSGNINANRYFGSSTIAVAHGGTGLTTIGAKNTVIYTSTTDNITSVTANASATRKFLRQVSENAPDWDTLADGDIPTSTFIRLVPSSTTYNTISPTGSDYVGLQVKSSTTYSSGDKITFSVQHSNGTDILKVNRTSASNYYITLNTNAGAGTPGYIKMDTSSGGTAGSIDLSTGTTSTGLGGNGGIINAKGGNGHAAGNNGGNGGSIYLDGNSATADSPGSDGGTIYMVAGSSTASFVGGSSGSIFCNGSAATLLAPGASGGSIALSGGASDGNANGGNGGTINAYGGDAGDTYPGFGGNGGSIYIQGGYGYQSNNGGSGGGIYMSGGNANSGGVGGAAGWISLVGSSASGYTDGSTGGNISMNGGNPSGTHAQMGGDAGSIIMSGGGASGNNAGGSAGSINTNGGNANPGVGNGTNGGNIFTYATGLNSGGSITTYGSTWGTGGYISTIGSLNSGSGNKNGGYINTSAGQSSGGQSGGNIDTSGGAAAGGSITTSNGGGSINTTGTGSIQLGVTGTRTTINGAAASNWTLTLPTGGGVSGQVLSTNGSGTTSWIDPPSTFSLTVNGQSYLSYSPTTLTANQVNLTSHVTGTLPVANGGTGVTSFGSTNTLLYTSSANTLSSITANNSGTRKFLYQSLSSSAPAWDTLQAGDMPAGAYVLIGPTSSSDNVITPTGNDTIGLSVKSSSSYSAGGNIFRVQHSSGTDVFGVSRSGSSTGYKVFFNTNAGTGTAGYIRINTDTSTVGGYIDISSGLTSTGTGGSGGTITIKGGSGNSAGNGGNGGSINLSGGDASITHVGVSGGSINMSAAASATGSIPGSPGSINTSSQIASSGGDILTYGGIAESVPGGSGGHIKTYGANASSVSAGGSGGSLLIYGGNAGTSSGTGGNGGTISLIGGNAGSGNGNAGRAGLITSNGGNAGSSTATGGNGGDINTSGSSASGATSGVTGGYIYTYATGIRAGGNIDTSGGASAAGGSITTSNGGGSINTYTGTLELGVAATRTTIKAASSTVTYILPTNGTNGQYLQLSNNSTGQLVWATSSSTASFDGITSGTNTIAAMIVSTGSSLTYSGSGTINASSYRGNSSFGGTNTILYASATDTLASLAANSGSKQFLTQTSSGTPAWSGIVDSDIPTFTFVRLVPTTSATNLIAPTASNISSLLVRSTSTYSSGDIQTFSVQHSDGTDILKVNRTSASNYYITLNTNAGAGTPGYIKIDNYVSGSGGYLNLSGSSSYTSGHIDMSGGVSGAGGSLLTTNGGGSINTFAGTIELGPSGGRTTIQKHVSSVDWTLTLPANAGTNGYVLTTNGSGNTSWADISAGSTYFNNILSGTNTSAIMTVGTGGSLTYSGSGTVNANQFKGNTTIALTDGGTNASLTASNGGIVYSTSSALAVLSGTATANKVLMSGSSSAPSWSTSTFAQTYVKNDLLFASGTNTVSGFSSANSSILITDGSGTPSWATDLPSTATIGTKTIARKYSTSYTFSGAGTQITVTHNLNSKDVIVRIWDSSDAEVRPQIVSTNTTTATVTFSQDQNGNTYRIVVVG